MIVDGPRTCPCLWENDVEEDVYQAFASRQIYMPQRKRATKISFRCNIHLCSFQEHLFLTYWFSAADRSLWQQTNLEWCKFSQQVIFYASDRFWMQCMECIPFVQSKMSKMWLGTWFRTWLKMSKQGIKLLSSQLFGTPTFQLSSFLLHGLRFPKCWQNDVLVDGFNPSEKYQSKWESSPNRALKKNIWNHHLVWDHWWATVATAQCWENHWWAAALPKAVEPVQDFLHHMSTLRRRLQQAVILSMLQNVWFPQAELATSSNASVVVVIEGLKPSNCNSAEALFPAELLVFWYVFFRVFHSGIPAFFITSIQPLGSLRIHPWNIMKWHWTNMALT